MIIASCRNLRTFLRLSSNVSKPLLQVRRAFWKCTCFLALVPIDRMRFVFLDFYSGIGTGDFPSNNLSVLCMYKYQVSAELKTKLSDHLLHFPNLLFISSPYQWTPRLLIKFHQCLLPPYATQFTFTFFI
jgi:hypothetical protein